MKNFRVTVNGVSYDVTVEEADGSSANAPAASAPVTSKIPAAPPASAVPAPPVPATAPAASGNSDAFVVKSPMPGVILDVCVNIGDTVSKHQNVILLEAMKMENEIVTPAEGKITAIHVAKGASVNTGDPLVSVI